MNFAPIKLYGSCQKILGHKHLRVASLPEKGYFLSNKIFLATLGGKQPEDRETDKDNHNTIKVVDYSDERAFEFGFICGLCGHEWRSERISFDYEKIADNLDIKDISFLWADEFQKAYNKAKLDAAIELNRCPTCGTWVCNDCFYVTNGEVTDFCLNCLEVVHETDITTEVKNDLI